MAQRSLFDDTQLAVPLASRLRPETLDELAGQKHLVGQGQLLRRLIENDQISSMIFWGPPGVGKTTLASIIASQTHANFVNFSAVTSGIKEIKEVMIQAEKNRQIGIKTVLFVDEIHRFNRAQQDAFLPYVEKGSIVLIGATTENPSFEINSALLSRCRVYVLKPLATEDIIEVLNRALTSPAGFGNVKIQLPENGLDVIAAFANGDARMALNTLEIAVTNGTVVNDTITVSAETLKQCVNRRSLLYDKNGEEHYNLISALHKSMRNSDPDAAVYWLARMLEGGEDPLYVARRLIRFASEDVGLADSNAILLATTVYQACHDIGMPECSVNLTQAVVYLSLAPKSNAMEVAYQKASQDAATMLAEPVPLQIRNAPTSLMKQLDYGKDYQYAHDYVDKITKMVCLPDSLKGRQYYEPTDQGREAAFKKRLDAIRLWRAGKADSPYGLPANEVKDDKPKE